MFSRVRLPTFWTDGTTVPGSEWEQFDANLANAIDGDGGGAYSLQADLVIGGAPGVIFELALDVLFDDDITVHGSATVQENLNVTENIHCLGEVETQRLQVNFTSSFGDVATFEYFAFFNDLAVFQGNALFSEGVDFNALADFNGPANFDDDADFNGPATFNGTLDANGNCFLGGVGHVVELGGPTELRGLMTMQGSGAIASRAVAGGASATYSPLTVHEVVLDDATGTVTYLINDAGCVNGNEILFTNTDPSAALFVRRLADNVLLKALTQQWGRFVRVAGVWRCVAFGDCPT